MFPQLQHYRCQFDCLGPRSDDDHHVLTLIAYPISLPGSFSNLPSGTAGQIVRSIIKRLLRHHGETSPRRQSQGRSHTLPSPFSMAEGLVSDPGLTTQFST